MAGRSKHGQGGRRTARAPAAKPSRPPEAAWIDEVVALAAAMRALGAAPGSSGERVPGPLLEGLAPDGAIRAELAWLERVRVHADGLRRRGIGRSGHISAIELQWLRELRQKVADLSRLRDAAHVAARLAVDACDQAIASQLRGRLAD